MAPQLRAQDYVPARKKPDTTTVQVFRGGLHNPAPIPKDAILQVDTVKAVPRGDGTCDFDAGTPIRKPGTLRAATQVDDCSIIYWTVDSAKFFDATKEAKRDTLAKPAVIYTYPGGRSTTDSVRVLQRPFVAPTPKRAKPAGPVTMVPPPPVKLDSSTVTLLRSSPHGTLPQWTTRADTAEIRRIALAYLKADSNYVRTVDRRPLQIRGDTAIATFFYGADVSVVRLERRQGKWVPTHRASGVQ